MEKSILRPVKQKNPVPFVFQRVGKEFRNGAVHTPADIGNFEMITCIGNGRIKIHTEHKRKFVGKEPFGYLGTAAGRRDLFVRHFHFFLMNGDAE